MEERADGQRRDEAEGGGSVELTAEATCIVATTYLTLLPYIGLVVVDGEAWPTEALPRRPRTARRIRAPRSAGAARIYPPLATARDSSHQQQARTQGSLISLHLISTATHGTLTNRIPIESTESNDVPNLTFASPSSALPRPDLCLYAPPQKSGLTSNMKSRSWLGFSLTVAALTGELVSAHGQQPALRHDDFAQAFTGPRSDQQQFRFWLRDEDDDDGNDNASIPFRFAGFNTFAKVPWADCFSLEGERYDIAILGAPHDTTVTARPGARYGPTGIRTASQQKAYGFSVFTGMHSPTLLCLPYLTRLLTTGRNPLHDWAKVVDCGDAPLPWLDNRAAIKTLDRAHKLVSSRTAANTDRSSVPRIVTLGGDHTTTLSALRSTAHNWGKVSVVHFDSHIGPLAPPQTSLEATHGLSLTRLPKIPGIPQSWAAAFPTTREAPSSQTTWTRSLSSFSTNLILNTSVHAGIRAPVNRRTADMENDRRCGFHTITARDLDKLGIQAVVDKIRQRVGDTNVYISVDIDVLDPAFAPATGTPEPGGWSSRELLSILEGLEGLNVIGGDVVEVAPVYDTVGETTALVAADIAHTIVDLMVANPVLTPEGRKG
ncbi:hypothetical protein PCL_10189 [Purpureocillium lilacinum]|uniref:Agmatinase n=1 Tax=Purpureocillium lilacinum TaxID=33203 RepID=A0A2U3EF82_PURLI|nr:hypothetical protein PCL_10189 [Purpureocillium lilacinum]